MSAKATDLERLGVPPEQSLENLVYLVGPARGGTSLVLDCLRLHPRALVLDDNHFHDHVWQYRNKVHDRLWRIIFHMPQFFDYQAIRNSLTSEQAALLGQYVNRVLAERKFSSLYKLYPALHALDETNQKCARSIACWCDKGTSWRGLNLVANEFPKARFVFITRDPRSVVLSHIKRAEITRFSKSSESVSTADVIRSSLYWRITMLMLLRFERRQKRPVHWLRYEDLLNDTQNSLTHLYEFAVGDSPTEVEIDRMVGRLKGGASNDPNEKYDGLSKEPISRWRTQLSAEQNDLISSVVKPTAIRLGYDIDNPNQWFGAAALMKRSQGGTERLKVGARLAAARLLERMV